VRIDEPLPTFRDILGQARRAGRLGQLLTELHPRQIRLLGQDWGLRAKPFQYPPRLSQAGLAWTIWLFLGGRGAGKTRAGAEWVAASPSACAILRRPVGRIALVGETGRCVRHVMVEGVSGVLAAHAHRERPRWLPSRRRLVWPNGAVAQVFSAEDPDSLRGPQFEAAWCDELAKWRYADATWNMLQFGLRLGERPAPAGDDDAAADPAAAPLLADPRAASRAPARMPTRRHLAPDFLAEMEERITAAPARPPGTRRRDRRGARRRFVDARRA
jgi:phage terminase large subunit-like protein